MDFDLHSLLENGFAVTWPLFSPTEIAQLIASIEDEAGLQSKAGGVRDIMNRIPALYAVTESDAIRSIVDELLGRDAFVVRSTLFDKPPDANWKVPWHQDVTIAVRERIDTEGYGPWSIKQGVIHVQPPAEVLNRMVTVRVHRDPCSADNGALRVMPGSHRLGRIDQNEAPKFVDEERAYTCEAQPGEALVMKPLLLHASSASGMPRHRRILHFDFASVVLENGLEWKLRADRKSA